MSFPAGGLESQYQANLKDVVHMLQRKHGNNYLFFNLSRRRHDINKLNMQVVDIGWPDQLAPPLEKLCSICKQIETWLKADASHVVVIHCKGGRGPIGVVVSAYMGYLNFSNSTDTALDRYAMRRFLDAKTGSAMHPSQHRYVEYFSGLLTRSIQINNSPLFLHYVFIHGVPNFDTAGGCRPFMRIYQNMQTVFTSGVYTVSEGTTRFAIPFDQALPLKGDILVKCYHKKFRSTTRDVIFRVQFHTTAVMEYRLVFQKSDLDDACTDPRFTTFSKVEFIFSATPDKVHNSDYVRGSSFPVENSNDPLIRWDSYEHFDSIIEGGDDVVDANMNATEIPHLSAPDGSLYAQVCKNNVPKTEQVNNSASTPVMNGPVQANGPLQPNGIATKSASPHPKLPVAAITNAPLGSSPKRGPSVKERQELDELLKGFDDLLVGIDLKETPDAGNFVSVHRQISQSQKADAAKPNPVPHAAAHISPTSPSRDSGYSRSSTEIENPYAEIHDKDKQGNKKQKESPVGGMHNPLYGEPIMRNNSNHHTNHMYHSEPSSSTQPVVNGQPVPNGQLLTFGQGMSNGPVEEKIEAELQSNAYSANPHAGTHSPLRYNANERLSNHRQGREDNRHYRSSSPLPHTSNDSHVLPNSTQTENQKGNISPGSPTRVNSYPNQVQSPTSPIRAQKEIIKIVHAGPTPSNLGSPLNDRQHQPSQLSPTPSETSSEGSTDGLTWLQRQQLKLKQKRDRERQSQGSASHPLYIDTMMGNRPGHQTPPLSSLSPRSDSYNRVNDTSSRYTSPPVSSGCILPNDIDHRSPSIQDSKGIGQHKDTPDPRVKKQVLLYDSPRMSDPIIATKVTRPFYQPSSPNQYPQYVPPPDAHHSPPQRDNSSNRVSEPSCEPKRLPMTNSRPVDLDSQSSQSYVVDPNVVSRPPRSPRKERVFSNPVNEKRMHQIERSLHANDSSSEFTTFPLNSSYTSSPNTNSSLDSMHASSNQSLINPQPTIYSTLNDQLMRAIPNAGQEGVVVRSTEHKVKTTLKFYPLDEYDKLVQSGEIQPETDDVEVIKYIPQKEDARVETGPIPQKEDACVENGPDIPAPSYNWVMNRIGSLRNLSKEKNNALQNDYLSQKSAYQSQPDLRGYRYEPTTSASQISQSFTPISKSEINVGLNNTTTLRPKLCIFPKRPSHPFQHESSLGSLNDLRSAQRFTSTGENPRTYYQSTPNLLHDNKIPTHTHGLDLTSSKSLSRLDEEDPLYADSAQISYIPRTAANTAKNDHPAWEHNLKSIGSYNTDITSLNKSMSNVQEGYYQVPRKVRFSSDSNLLGDSLFRAPSVDEPDAKAGEPVQEPVIKQGTVASRVADARARINELERSMSPPALERQPRSLQRSNSAAGYENGSQSLRSRTPSPEVWMRNPGGQPQQETYYWNRVEGLKSPEIEARREKERLIEYGPGFETPPNTPSFPLDPKTPYVNLVSTPTPLAFVGRGPEDKEVHYIPPHHSLKQTTPQQNTPQKFTQQSHHTPEQSHTPQQNSQFITPHKPILQQDTPQHIIEQHDTPQLYTKQQDTPQQNSPQQYYSQQNTPQQNSPLQYQQDIPQQNSPQQYNSQQNTPPQFIKEQDTPQEKLAHQYTPQQSTPQTTQDRQLEMSPSKMNAPNTTEVTVYRTVERNYVPPQATHQTRHSQDALRQHSPEQKSVHFDIDDFFETRLSQDVSPKSIANKENGRKEIEKEPQISPVHEKIEKSRVRFVEEGSPKKYQDENRNEHNMKDLTLLDSERTIIPTNQHQVEVQVHHTPPPRDQPPTRVAEMPHSLPYGVPSTGPYPQYTLYSGPSTTTYNGQASPSGSHDVSPTAPFASVDLPPRNYYPTFSDRKRSKAAAGKPSNHKALPESEQPSSLQGDVDMSGYRTVYDNRGKHAKPGSPASVRSGSSVNDSGRTTPSNFYLNEQPSLSSSQTSLAEPGVENVRFVKDLSSWWYKPHITRDDAISMLKDKQPGTFVVRDSNSFPGAFGLAVKVATPPPNAPQQRKAGDPVSELVRHFLIEPNSRGVKLKGCQNEPIFGSLSALVYQHTMKQLALPCKLVLPETDPANVPGSGNDANSRANLLAKGAACNVLYLHSFDMESLTGSSAVCEATNRLTELSTKPPSIIVHFKVSSKGITVTDNNRKLFFRRHYPVDSVLFCGSDSGNRRWQRDESSKEADARIFGFVSRKPGSITDNVCHLFAEYEKEQPASAIVSFVTKVLIGQTSNTSVKSP